VLLAEEVVLWSKQITPNAQKHPRTPQSHFVLAMPIISVRFQFLLPILPQPSQFLRPSASWTVSRKLIAVEIAPSTKSQIPSPDRTHQTSNLHALTHLGPAKALSLQS